MKYWLMKSEPDVFGIDDLQKKKSEFWDGVRNYQARNYMRDEMKIGDHVLFYHSNAKPSGIAGVAKISREAVPDFTSWNSNSKYFDPKSTESNPRWFMVEVTFVEKFNDVIPLEWLKKNSKLKDMLVIKKGMRLSIQPVLKTEFELVLKQGRSL